MDDRTSKVKAIITRRLILQIAQSMTPDIMYKEIASLREAIALALKDEMFPSFAERFNNTYLLLGKRVDADSLNAVERFEDAIINHVDVVGSFLEDEIGL